MNRRTAICVSAIAALTGLNAAAYFRKTDETGTGSLVVWTYPISVDS